MGLSGPPGVWQVPHTRKYQSYIPTRPWCPMQIELSSWVGHSVATAGLSCRSAAEPAHAHPGECHGPSSSIGDAWRRLQPLVPADRPVQHSARAGPPRPVAARWSGRPTRESEAAGLPSRQLAVGTARLHRAGAARARESTCRPPLTVGAGRCCARQEVSFTGAQPLVSARHTISCTPRHP